MSKRARNLLEELSFFPELDDDNQEFEVALAEGSYGRDDLLGFQIVDEDEEDAYEFITQSRR